MSAVWTRDNKRWQIETDVAKASVPSIEKIAEKEGLLIDDICALPTVDITADPTFIAVWSEPMVEGEQRWLLVDADTITLDQTIRSMSVGKSARTISVRSDDHRNRYYTVTWSTQGAPAEIWAQDAGHDLPYNPQFEISWAPPLRLTPSASIDTEASPPGSFASILTADTTFESKLVRKGATDTGNAWLDIEQVRKWIERGYRPAGISVGESPTDSKLGGGTPFTYTLLLQRPIIPDTAKESLALQQAKAAIALLQMDTTARVWPLLTKQPDPRLRSYLLFYMTQYKIDPASIIARLKTESDLSSRCTLIIAIGDYATGGLLSETQKADAIKDLLQAYAEASDSGIHASCEWTLKKLGAQVEIAKLRTQFATGRVVGNREWYVSRQGQHTMILVHPEHEFLMGSPVTEPGRRDGPANIHEALHQRSVGRHFAIASHEVTVAQFKAFREKHGSDRDISRDLDAPVRALTCYDAIAYCNWLSRQEGIPENEWCYRSGQPSKPYAEGLEMFPDYLQRTGYRLPTEAEWEYACRAGVTTARYYGETEQLLTRYACYSKNSEGLHPFPVGSLRPNDLGLFDMIGNTYEWTQDMAQNYGYRSELFEDKEQLEKITNSVARVMRGGSFDVRALYLRSAYRNLKHPDFTDNFCGFRPARTVR